MNDCIFNNDSHSDVCKALKKKECRNCTFYKSKTEYRRTDDGFIVRKEGYEHGITSIDNR